MLATKSIFSPKARPMLPTLASKAYQMVFINPGIHEGKKKKKRPQDFYDFLPFDGFIAIVRDWER